MPDINGGERAREGRSYRGQMEVEAGGYCGSDSDPNQGSGPESEQQQLLVPVPLFVHISKTRGSPPMLMVGGNFVLDVSKYGNK